MFAPVSRHQIVSSLMRQTLYISVVLVVAGAITNGADGQGLQDAILRPLHGGGKLSRKEFPSLDRNIWTVAGRQIEGKLIAVSPERVVTARRVRGKIYIGKDDPVLLSELPPDELAQLSRILGGDPKSVIEKKMKEGRLTKWRFTDWKITIRLVDGSDAVYSANDIDIDESEVSRLYEKDLFYTLPDPAEGLEIVDRETRPAATPDKSRDELEKDVTQMFEEGSVRSNIQSKRQRVDETKREILSIKGRINDLKQKLRTDKPDSSSYASHERQLTDCEADLLRAERSLASFEKQVADAEAELERLESKSKK